MSTIEKVSVVVPTRHEAGNVPTLLARLPTGLAEVIFVDDSDDDTPAAIGAVKEASHQHVRLIHRRAGERTGGLSGAVTRGIAVAVGEWVCVLDADLQHPPEVVTALTQRAALGDVDVVVGCRAGDEAYAAMPIHRRLLSKAAGRSAHLTFRRRLRTADPMSGLFMVRRASLDASVLRADGFKILLEILITHPDLRVAEVPYVFASRHAGESKGNFSEGMRFARHLVRLYARDVRRRRRGPAGDASSVTPMPPPGA